MNNDVFLPIGSVINVDGIKKPVIVVGYGLKDAQNVYKYIGFAYPECYLPNGKGIMFNQNRITNILFMGYKNEDYTKISNIVNRVMEMSDK